MSAAVSRTILFAWLTILTVAVVYLAFGRTAPAEGTATFEELTVYRLNVVEPDGKPRLVIANRERMPGLYWGGKEYRHHSRDSGGMLFFNREGDEVGGLSFDAVREGDQYGAHAGLMFDQYKQDQTVGLVYNDSNGRRQAGIRVWDRPDQSLFPLIELSDKAARAESEAERQQIRAEMMEIARSWGPQGERFFAGKVEQDAIVRLADRHGRPRLVLRVDGEGAASVEFLDETGKVVRRIPER